MKKSLYRILAVLVLLVCALGLANLPADTAAWANDKDWEQFQNDLYNSGVTAGPAPVSSVKVGWKVQAGHTDPAQMAAGVNNTPLVADGKVLVMGALADTWLLDAKSGDTVWTRQLSCLKQKFQLATPVYGDGTYFVATNDGHVYALAAGDGAELWKKDLFQYAVDAGLSVNTLQKLRDNAQLNSPLKYDSGKIYLGVWGTTQTDLNYYFCLDAKNGEVLWDRKVTSGNLGYYWSGPCVIGGYLLYGDQNNYITCVDKATGATVSEIKLTDIDPSGYWVRCSVSYSPATGCVYFGDEHGYLWAFDFNTATGELTHRWHKKLGGLINSTPAIHNDRLYVGTNLYTKLGDLFCLDAATGEEIWRFTPELKSGDDSSGYYSEPGIQASPSIYVQDGKPYIYFTTQGAYATVYCLDQNGKKVWEFENEEAGLSEGYTTSSIAISDGWVYFGNDGGFVYGLTSADGDVKGAAGPVITLNGAAQINLPQGAAFTDPGAKASDVDGGDISAGIVVGGDTVDTNTVGTYTITYNVTGAAGKAAAEVRRIVRVIGSGTDTGQDKITVYVSIEDMYGKQRFSGQVEAPAGATVLDVMYAAEKLDPDLAMAYDPDNPYITGGYIESMYGQDSPWGERSDGWIYYVGGDYQTGTMPNRGVGVWPVAEGEEIYWYWGTMEGYQPLSQEPETGFSDLGEDHWARRDIHFMVDKKLTAGYPDGTFKPDRPVSRAEFTLLLARVLAIPEVAEKSVFSDVQLNDWYNGGIAAAHQKGLVNGYDTGHFYPDNPVTREEAAALLINALKYQGKIADQPPVPAELEKLNDKEEISAWARNAVAQALQENLLHGFPDGAFKPRESTTRAQAVTMLRLLSSE